MTHFKLKTNCTHLLLLLLLSFTANAQETNPTVNSTLQGKIIDSLTNEPLAGATVSITGVTNSAQTDANGNFQLITGQKLPYSIKVSYIGYHSKTLLATSSPITVPIAPNIATLAEVQITDGYFTQLRKTYTGAATTISGAVNENKPFSTPLAALQGEVPGLNISLSSSQPGANIQVRLRGLGSTALNSNPLYVIDGMIINAGDLSSISTTSNVLAGINQNDIENITVLKDASATAIYGSRGSNGVIVITTKKGKSGRTQINFDTEVGTTNVTPFPEAGQPLTANQYATLFLEGLRNAGTYTQRQMDDLAESYGFNSGRSNNWQDLIYRTGTQQQYNVSLRGGNENTKVFTSAGYFKQEATTLASDMRRFTGLLNVDQKISNRISLTTGLNISNVNQHSPNGGTGSWGNPIFAGRILRPFQMAYNPDGSFNTDISSNLGYVAHYNVLYIAENDKRDLSQTHILGNANLNWDIWNQLKFSSYFSIDYNNLEESVFNNPVLGDGVTSKGRASNAYTRFFNWLSRNQLDYRYNIPNIENFYVTAAVGYEAQRSQQLDLSAEGTGFPLTQPDLNSLANAATPTDASASTSNYAFTSVYARLNLNFKNKYALSGSYRRDGSSVFGANNRYGNFFSVGGTWNIDEERFFQQQQILSSAKLRASYGTTGNAQGIGNYSARALASYGANYTTGNGQNYNVVGNPDLTWEKAKKLDIGADLGFLQDRLGITVDYYRNLIDGLIQSVSISRTTGFSAVPYANVGAMVNRGFELGIRGDAIKQENFSWTTSFNISHNHNEVTKLGNAPGVNGNYYYQLGYDYYTYYTPLYAGVNPDNGEALWYTDATKTATTNSYGNATRAPYKTSNPKYFGGFNNTVNYKGIRLDIDFYYNFGNYVVDSWSTRFYDGAYYTFNKYQREYDKRWTTPGQITDVPKYVAGGGTQSNSNSFSSRFIYDGSFIRLKNVSIGYDLKNLKVFQHISRITKLYLYARGSNLWTKTYDERLPFDPESGNVTIPIYKIYTFGINVSL